MLNRYTNIPKSIHDVKHNRIMGYGAKLAPFHPGFGDQVYMDRRVTISELAKTHVAGTPIPRVQYTGNETAVWGIVLSELDKLLPKHACTKYLENFDKFGFSTKHVPQLDQVSSVLHKTTGWQLRPVSGLLHPREFLAGLAFKHFHSTQYIRHYSSPWYTPEPDVCHELIGHVPMLADPDYSDLMVSFGKASLGLDDDNVWKLTNLYWNLIEFGTIRESDSVKAFGAGILSSVGEMEHMAGGFAPFVSFDKCAISSGINYKDGFQKQYARVDTFEDAQAMLESCFRSFVDDEENLRSHYAD